MQALMTVFDYMADRKRKRKTYLLDPLVIEGIAQMARLDGRSENQFVERLFYRITREAGVIDPDEELLGESRGGLRKPSQPESTAEPELTEENELTKDGNI